MEVYFHNTSNQNHSEGSKKLHLIIMKYSSLLYLILASFCKPIQCAYVNISLSSTNVKFNQSISITLEGMNPVCCADLDRLELFGMRLGEPYATLIASYNRRNVFSKPTVPNVAYRDRVVMSGGSNVTISQVTVADEKAKFHFSYTYFTKAGTAIVESRKLELEHVFILPIFGSSLRSISTAIEGISKQISCVVKSRPASNITWSHDAEVVGVQTQNVMEDGNYFITTGTLNITQPMYSTMNTKNVICAAKPKFGAPIQQTTTLNILYRPKNTQFSVTPSNLALNTNVQLSCSATGLPNVRNYRFYVNNILIGNTTDGKLTAMVSPSVCVKYTGEYKCVPESTIGDGEIKTTAREFELSSVTLSPSKAVDAGQDVTLQCSAKDCPTSVITWKKNGISLAGKTGNRLQILSVTKDDTGEYSCHATFWKTNKSAKMNLTMTRKPNNIQFTTQTLKPKNGDRVVLSCSSSGTPTPTYRIYKITGSDRKLVSNGASYSIASINYVDYTGYKANFRCESENTLGNITQDIQLDIQVKPILAVSIDAKVNEGSNVTFSCNITAANPFTNLITWENPANRLITHSNGIVRINFVSSQHRGRYSCHARNSAGASTKSFTLSVNSKVSSNAVRADKAVRVISGLLVVTVISLQTIRFDI